LPLALRQLDNQSGEGWPGGPCRPLAGRQWTSCAAERAEPARGASVALQQVYGRRAVRQQSWRAQPTSFEPRWTLRPRGSRSRPSLARGGGARGAAGTRPAVEAEHEVERRRTGSRCSGGGRARAIVAWVSVQRGTAAKPPTTGGKPEQVVPELVSRHGAAASGTRAMNSSQVLPTSTYSLWARKHSIWQTSS
jgi:hypothetical protein